MPKNLVFCDSFALRTDQQFENIECAGSDLKQSILQVTFAAFLATL